MRLLVLFAAASLWSTAAEGPAGFAVWKGAELKGFEKKLSAKIDEKKLAGETLGKYGNHTVGVTHREGSGEAELHETQADILVGETGEATLVVGGTIVEPKTASPHEVRGSSIKGGMRKRFGPGDIVHIPAKTPHQLLLDPGKQFTYAVVKIDSTD
jgi:hypothetical protein